MPGDEEGTGEKCEKLAERIAGKRSLLEGLNKGKGIKVIFIVSNHSESMTNRKGSTKRRSRLGITSFGVTDKKIWMFFCQGPICNENIFNQGPEQKKVKT